MVFALEIDAPCDPFELAGRLADRPGLAVLAATDTRGEVGRCSFIACDPDDHVTTLDPLGGGRGIEHRSGGTLVGAPRFIGVLPYEARRSLERRAWIPPTEARPAPSLCAPSWWRYPAVVAIDHHLGRVSVIGASRSACRDLARRLDAIRSPAPTRRELVVDVSEPEPAEAHEARVRRAIELIHAGDLYQVNLARRLALTVHDGGSGGGRPTAGTFLALGQALLRAAATPFGACLATHEGPWVLSTSPELFLDASASSGADAWSSLVTEPIKGTRARGRDALADAALARELDADPKERAELTMIVDVERNDLARVSKPGTVIVCGPPSLVAFRTVWHRLCRVRGAVRAGMSRANVLEAMLPSGSVTGAPKVRAMEIIASLEPVRRGLYTGALGYVAHDGSARLSMAIRTAVVDPDGRGEYLVGGGIVADSDPARELLETRWKAEQLRRVASQLSRADAELDPM